MVFFFWAGQQLFPNGLKEGMMLHSLKELQNDAEVCAPRKLAAAALCELGITRDIAKTGGFTRSICKHL